MLFGPVNLDQNLRKYPLFLMKRPQTGDPVQHLFRNLQVC